MLPTESSMCCHIFSYKHKILDFEQNHCAQVDHKYLIVNCILANGSQIPIVKINPYFFQCALKFNEHFPMSYYHNDILEMMKS